MENTCTPSFFVGPLGNGHMKRIDAPDDPQHSNFFTVGTTLSYPVTRIRDLAEHFLACNDPIYILGKCYASEDVLLVHPTV